MPKEPGEESRTVFLSLCSVLDHLQSVVNYAKSTPKNYLNSRTPKAQFALTLKCGRLEIKVI